MNRTSLRKAAFLGLVAYGAITAIVTGPAYADDRDRRDHERREHGWRDHHAHWDHRYWDGDHYVYNGGVEVYQPPPVVYTPPPEPGIGFVFRVR
jgi:hypothetical protein